MLANHRSALIAYEHITTFSQEYELMWGTKMTGATLIFFVNRYLLLAYCIVTPLQVISWDTPLVSLTFYAQGTSIDSLVCPEVCVETHCHEQTYNVIHVASCQVSEITYQAFLITLYAAVAGKLSRDFCCHEADVPTYKAFTALRTFAISGHSRYLALITLALALMPFCTTIVGPYMTKCPILTGIYTVYYYQAVICICCMVRGYTSM